MANKFEKLTEKTIFWSRWLQAPLYFGLIGALFVYIILFIKELAHLFGSIENIKVHDIIVQTLSLIDAVMISNLIFVVIIGGWQTFVSRLDLEAEKDKPEWLSYINAGVLKVKLATAIVSITSIELLIDFFQSEEISEKTLIWRTIIHCVFLISAVAIAYIESINAKLYHSKDH